MKKINLILVFIILMFSCNSNTDDTLASQACDNGTFIPENGFFRLETQQEINDFGALCYSKIEGSLTIGLESGMFSEVESLTALNSLKEITGYFRVARAPNLQSLNGLHNLETVGTLDLTGLQITSLEELINLEHAEGLSVFALGSLTDLQGLENLTYINSLSIDNCNNLVSINELENIENTEISFLRFSSNPLLESIEVLDFLVGVEDIRLHDNEALASLVGLHNITSVGQITISNCNGLTSMEGLNTLNNVEYAIDLDRNNSLLKLDGLENLSFVGDFLYLGGFDDVPGSTTGNNNLSDFCALEPLFTSGFYPEIESILINNNAYNPTVQDIIEGNCSN